MLIYLSVLETDHEKHEFMALYAEYHAVMLRVAKKYFPTDQMARRCRSERMDENCKKFSKNFCNRMQEKRRLLRYNCKERMYFYPAKNKAAISLDELPLATSDELKRRFFSHLLRS